MNRIKLLRKEHSLTQVELGKILNISDRSIGFYENGKRNPDLETLKLLAKFFKVSIDYILGINDRRNYDNHIISNAFHNISTDGLTKEDINLVKSLVTQLKKKNK